MKGKTVIITGASSGIGEACAFKLAKHGLNLMLCARNLEKLNAVKNTITSQYKVEVITIKTDVSIEDDCKILIEETLKQFGKIDMLINNAGISMRALFENTDLDVIRKVMNTNFWATVYCTKYALPYLLHTKGSVIGISSVAGYKGLPGRSGYSASKFAMRGFLESLRIEHLKTGLHVLLIAPGFTNTNIRNVALTKDGKIQSESPLDESQLMSSEEVADQIVDGITRRKREIILTTQGKLTILINKFFPSFIDKIVYNHFAKEDNSPLK